MYKNCLIIDTEQTYGDVGYVITQETKIVSFGQLIIGSLFEQTKGSDGHKKKAKRYQSMAKQPKYVTLPELFTALNELIAQYKVDTIVCHSLAADKKVFASWALDREVVNPFVRSDIELYDSTKIAKAILGGEHKEYGLEYTISALYGEKIKQHHTGLDDAALTALLVISGFYYQTNLNNAAEPMKNRAKQLVAAYFASKENLHMLVEQADCASIVEEKIIQEYNIILDAVLSETKHFGEQLHSITEDNLNQYASVVSQQQSILTKHTQSTIAELQSVVRECGKDISKRQQELIAITDKYCAEIASMERQLAFKRQELAAVEKKLQDDTKEYKFRKIWSWLCPVVGVCCGVLAFILLFVLV